MAPPPPERTPADATTTRRERLAPAPAARRRARDTPRPSRPPHSRRRGSSRAPAPQLLELLPRARVHDVVLCQPTATRHANAEFHVALRADRMRVGVDDELQPGFLRRARVHIAQVEPVGLPIDLQEASDLDRLLDHALDVDRPRPANADPPAGQMADAVDIWIVHRLEHALCRAI